MSYDKWSVAVLSVERTIIDDMIDDSTEHNLLSLYGPFDTYRAALDWARKQREQHPEVRTCTIPAIHPPVEDATVAENPCEAELLLLFTASLEMGGGTS